MRFQLTQVVVLLLLTLTGSAADGAPRRIGDIVVHQRVRRDGSRVRLFYRAGSGHIAGASLVASGGHRRLSIRVGPHGVRAVSRQLGRVEHLQGKTAVGRAARALRPLRLETGPAPEPGQIVEWATLPQRLRKRLDQTDAFVTRKRLPRGAVVAARGDSGVSYLESVAPSSLNPGFQHVGLRWTEALRGHGDQARLVGFLYNWPSTGFDARVTRGEVHVRMAIRLEDGVGTGQASLLSLGRHLKREIERTWDSRVVLVDTAHRSRRLPVRFTIDFHTDKRPGEHAVVKIQGPDYGDNHANWSIAVPKGVAAHEVGHHLGNIDEYGAGREAPLRPRPAGPSVMKASRGLADELPRARHFRAVAAWLGAETGRRFVVREHGR